MSEERILEKVRKLLAMANHENANETERDTALRQAHALLTKHGLDMVSVENHQREKVDPRGEFVHEDWSIPWTRTVRVAIAKLFMCKYFYGEKINGTRQRHYFVGRESNATTAEYMSVFVVGAILKEGRSRYGHNLCPETRAFGEGAAHRLNQRVEQMIATKIQEVQASDGKGLALIDLRTAEHDENELYVKDWKVRKGVTRNTNVDSKAYRAGREHADNIGLNVQVSTTQAPKQLN
jgi:hypothetical protein